MWTMSNIPTEIVRVRAERKVLLMRVPGFWAKSRGVISGNYVVARPGPDNTLILSTFDDEVSNGKAVGNDSDGRDR